MTTPDSSPSTPQSEPVTQPTPSEDHPIVDITPDPMISQLIERGDQLGSYRTTEQAPPRADQ